jgi:hypothetical protein
VKKILAVALKELRQIRRDPLSLAMLVGVPAMMLLLYGYALNFDVKHVALAVQDNDKSQASRALVDAFVRSTYFDLAVDLPAGADLERVTERRRAKAILVIPEGFGDDLESGKDAPVQLLVDGTDSQTATTLLGYAQGVVESRNRAIRLGRFGEGAPGTQVPIEYRPRVWYNPDLESTQFLVPGLIGMTYATSAGLLYLSGLAFGFFLLSAGPIAFQYAAEITHPAPEGTSNSLLILMGQVSGIAFIVAMDALKDPATGSMTKPLLALAALMVASAGLATALGESPIRGGGRDQSGDVSAW